MSASQPHPRPLVGRDREMAELARFLEEGSGATHLVLSGDAGIGKTALWQAGLERAEAMGWRVLSTRSSPGEAGLEFAGLSDLVDGMDASVLAEVPAPQLHALEVALRRAPPGPAATEPLAIALGFLGAVRALDRVARPLIAVDDVQWLDSSSAECLMFLAKRVSGSGVRLLLSRRGDEPSPFEQVLEPGDDREVRVEGLSLGATGRLLLERLGLLLPRRVLRQLHEAAQGNPLFTLELGRTLQEEGVPDIGTDLPLPRHVDTAFARRVGRLPVSMRTALLAVALSAGLTRADLEALVDPMAVQDSLDAGLLVLERSHVRPAHPMLAAAARKQSGAAERRALHVAISGVVADPVLSARHQALSTTGPASEVAATVAAAARTALEQGAVHAAEELSAHALRLTPAGRPERTDRVLELARCQLNAGDLAGAAALLRENVTTLPPGRPRALARLLLGEAVDGVTEEQQLDLALVEAAGDDQLYGTVLCRKSVMLSCFQVSRLPEAEALAREAMAYTERSPDAGRGRLALAWSLALRGQPVEHLCTETGSAPLGANLLDHFAERPAAVRRAFRGQLVEAGEILGRLDALAESRGDPRTRLGLRVQACEFALRRGDVVACMAAFGDLELWTSVEEMEIVCARLNALMAATGGRPAEARRWAKAVMDTSRVDHRSAWDQLEALRATGLADLYDGDPAAAALSLGKVWAHCRRNGIEDPGAFPVAGDLVDALVGIGALERALEVTDLLDRRSDEQDHPWGRATAKRARCTMAAATGDPEQAGAGLLEAADDYGRLGLDFERARTLLLSGSRQRQARRRAGARRALEEAAGTFERLGCEGWTDQARSELARVSGRRPADYSRLTANERRVAELATSGMSNKEIARALTISVHTVEAHLSHAYAKLGVRSRTQLAGSISPTL